MKRIRLASISIVSLFLITGVRAEDPEILHGYGKSRWGESVEELKVACPDLLETKSEAPGMRFFSVKGSGTVTDLRFFFVDDKLYGVQAFFSDEVTQQVGAEYLLQMLKEKYGKLAETEVLVEPGVSHINPDKTKLVIKVFGKGTGVGLTHLKFE